MKRFEKPPSGGAGRAFPALCLVISIILIFALAGSSGRSVFISAFDSFPPSSPSFAEASAAPAEEETPPDPLMLEADRLLKRFGVKVVFGESVMRSLGAYRIEPAIDGERISAALAEVGRVLAMFPDGFFLRLTGGGIRGLRIELSGGVAGAPPPLGLTGTDGDFRVIVLSVNAEPAVIRATLAHELCHVIDLRLDCLAASDPSHWNGEDWLALCPPGFAYGEGSPAYTAEDGSAGVWFINRSAKASPYEDRAEIFEALMLLGPDSPIIKSPHIAAKLRYCLEAVKYYLIK